MINIKDVTFGYSSSAKVLEDFSLQFQDGGVYGLLGKNGTGKSTLLYLITGLLRAQKGSVEVDGVDARKRNAEILSEIFIVPEEYDLPAISLNSYVKATTIVTISVSIFSLYYFSRVSIPQTIFVINKYFKSIIFIVIPNIKIFNIVFMSLSNIKLIFSNNISYNIMVVF